MEHPAKTDRTRARLNSSAPRRPRVCFVCFMCVYLISKKIRFEGRRPLKPVFRKKRAGKNGRGKAPALPVPCAKNPWLWYGRSGQVFRLRHVGLQGRPAGRFTFPDSSIQWQQRSRAAMFPASGSAPLPSRRRVRRGISPLFLCSAAGPARGHPESQRALSYPIEAVLSILFPRKWGNKKERGLPLSYTPSARPNAARR